MLSAAQEGFLLGLSLIVAIGAQNLFVLRQGLKHEHALAVAFTCSFIDSVLIYAGVAGGRIGLPPHRAGPGVQASEGSPRGLRLRGDTGRAPRGAP